METVFLKIVNLSIAAGWIVLAVLILRQLFKKVPKWIYCVFWAVAGIRLVFPFSLESAFSLLPSAQTIPPNILTNHAPMIDSGIAALNSTVNPVISEKLAPQQASSFYPVQAVISVASVVWLAGAGIMLLYMVISFLRLRNKLRTSTPLYGNIRQSENVSSPFVFGIFRPKIYLPYRLDERSFPYITAHEQAHLKRRDHWIKPVAFLILSAYWFHPLIWIAYLLLCRDIEYACDEKVIKHLEKDRRKEYSKALATNSVGRRRIAACPLAFGGASIPKRVKNVIHYQKPAFWIILAAILAGTVTAVCLLTAPKTVAVDTRLDAFLSQTILKLHESDHFLCESHIPLAIQTNGDETTVYAMVLCNEYRVEDGNFQRESSTHGPAAVTVKKTQSGEYTLLEYWTPRDGKDFKTDVREKFPWHIRSKALDTRRYLQKQEKDCEKQAGDYLQIQKQFHVEQIVFSNGIYSFDYTPQTAPRYAVSQNLLYTADGASQTNGRWQELGRLQKIQLTDKNFDQIIPPTFWEDGVTAAKLRRENEAAWYLAKKTDDFTQLYYVLLQKNGDVYIAYGYLEDRVLENASIRWVFRMKNNTGLSYVYATSKDPLKPYFYLYEEDKTFQFCFSALSSYIAVGNYEQNGEKLILKTEDGKYVYTFRMQKGEHTQSYCFDETDSSKLPQYEPLEGIPDGAEFICSTSE